MRRIARALVCGLLVGGCTSRPKTPPCARGQLELELRDSAGALTWSVRDLGPGRAPASTNADPSDAVVAHKLALCDANDRQRGALWVRNSAHRVGLIDDHGWRLELRLAGDDLVGAALGRLALRVHDDGHTVHVLDGQGVPFGSFSSDEHGAMLVYDRASMATTRIEARDRDAALSAVGDGAVRGYVTGRAEKIRPAAAAFFALPLPPEEQLALYFAWVR